MIPEILEIDDDLVLRQFDVFDDIALFKLANRNRAELARYRGLIGIETYDDCARSITIRRQAAEEGQACWFGIFFQEKLVGNVCAVNLHQPVYRATLSYWLDREYWGRGLATRSVERLIQFLFDVYQVPEVRIYCERENLPSVRLAERSGFKRFRPNLDQRSDNTLDYVWFRRRHHRP